MAQGGLGARPSIALMDAGVVAIGHLVRRRTVEAGGGVEFMSFVQARKVHTRIPPGARADWEALMEWLS